MVINYKESVKKILESRKKTGGIDKIYFVACGGSKAELTIANFFLSCEAKKLKHGFIRLKNLCYVHLKH